MITVNKLENEWHSHHFSLLHDFSISDFSFPGLFHKKWRKLLCQVILMEILKTCDVSLANV